MAKKKKGGNGILYIAIAGIAAFVYATAKGLISFGDNLAYRLSGVKISSASLSGISAIVSIIFSNPTDVSVSATDIYLNVLSKKGDLLGTVQNAQGISIAANTETKLDINVSFSVFQLATALLKEGITLSTTSVSLQSVKDALLKTTVTIKGQFKANGQTIPVNETVTIS
jgi:LEA14-like dessication related protein